MSLENQFHGNTCLFCGQIAKEHFYSGSYETYLKCDCLTSREYWGGVLKVQALESIAKGRLKRINLANRKTELERELSYINKELQ